MIVDLPEAWTILYADPSMQEQCWEPKEDLLQLKHHDLDRLVDLGWYQNGFAIFVFQGDFHGRQLDEFRTPDQSTALNGLHRILEKWGKP